MLSRAQRRLRWLSHQATATAYLNTSTAAAFFVNLCHHGLIMVSTRSTSGRDSSHSIHADSKVYSVQHSNGPVPNGIGAGYEQSLHKRPRALGSAREAEQYQHQADLREQQFLQRQDGSSVPLPPGLTQRQYDLIRESPFLDLDSPMTAYEWLKFVLYLPIFLIRLILIALLMPPCWLFSRLITIGMQPNQPLKPWRVALIRPFARFWAAVLLIVGMNCYFSVKGKENIEAARKVSLTGSLVAGCISLAFDQTPVTLPINMIATLRACTLNVAIQVLHHAALQALHLHYAGSCYTVLKTDNPFGQVLCSLLSLQMKRCSICL